MGTLYLAIRTDWGEIGIESTRVARVVLGADWHEAHPIDVEALVQPPGPGKPPTRVLVVQTPGGELGLGTSRELVLRQVSPEDVHNLPRMLWVPGTTPLLRRIVHQPDTAPLLLLDTAKLAAIAARSGEREGSSAAR